MSNTIYIMLFFVKKNIISYKYIYENVAKYKVILFIYKFVD